MMAHPVSIADIATLMYMYIRQRIYWVRTAHRAWAPITVVAIVVIAIIVSYQTPVASAYSASYCTTKTVTVHSDKNPPVARTVLRGPAYADIWVNTGLVPMDAAWRIPKNPSWGQALVKVRIDSGVPVHVFNGAFGTFVQYKPNDANCQLRMIADYNADPNPAKTLANMADWQILDFWP